jgi:hypothetical protein
MKVDIVETISKKLITEKNNNNEISELEKKKVKYGVYILYVNVSKIGLLLILAYFMGIFTEVLLNHKNLTKGYYHACLGLKARQIPPTPPWKGGNRTRPPFPREVGGICSSITLNLATSTNFL